MEPRDVVVIGGSTGSIQPLRELLAALPADLPGSVAVTIHVTEQARSQLPWILAHSGPLAAAHAQMGEPMQQQRVYVAPPGCHLLMPGGKIELSNGPRINRTRPAVDAMFASAARWFGDRVVAVVLSGLLDDGAVGAALVARAGGLVVVQDPQDAAQPSMPQAALAAAPGAITAPSAGLGEMVSAMLGAQGLAAWPHAQPRDVAEVTMEESSDLQFLSPEETRLTRLTCPDCGGALAEATLPQISYYRCHVGHQFGPQSLAAAQAETAETKLWAAVAALEETAALARHLSAHAETGHDVAGQEDGTATWAADLAESVRTQVLQTPRASTPRPPGDLPGACPGGVALVVADAADGPAGLLSGSAVPGGVSGISGGELVVKVGDGLFGGDQVGGQCGQPGPGGSGLLDLLLKVTGEPARLLSG